MIDNETVLRIALQNFYMKGNFQAIAWRYGVDKDWILAQIAQQEGKCACCSLELDGRKWCIDHSHETGKVRGILCYSCNLAIRKITHIKQIIEYLRKHGA
jgi:hypothetical protein